MNFLKIYDKLINLNKVRSIEANQLILSIVIDYDSNTDVIRMRDREELRNIFDSIANILKNKLTDQSVSNTLQDELKAQGV